TAQSSGRTCVVPRPAGAGRVAGMALPRLEVPPDALVLFESVPEGLDRSGGYRFAVIADGRFLHGGNSALQVDRETRDDDDPAHYWTGPMEPVANFDANA